jgi:hypothetical protein
MQFTATQTRDRLLIPNPDLRVFGSRPIEPAIPELFVAAQRRYAARVSPSYDLVCLNRFDAYIQFTGQFRNAQAPANKRENLQLTIAQAIDIGAARIFIARCEVA